MPGSNLPLMAAAVATLAGAALFQRRRARTRAAEASRQRRQAELEQQLARRTEEVQQLAAQLERLRADYDRFAYIISHDLTEPLRSITGFSWLLQRRLGDTLPAEAQQYLGFITDGSHHLQALIDGLLAYSRAGAPLQEPQPVALESLLARVQAQHAALLEESSAVLESDPLPVVTGDPQRLLQLFQHLIGNALKFRSATPPQIRIRVEANRDDWTISIADNGIGIDPAQQQRVLDIFQRLHAREDYAGVGVGLPISQRIVESHGGRMWLQSTPGQGSTVLFTLPKAEPAAAGPL